MKAICAFLLSLTTWLSVCSGVLVFPVLSPPAGADDSTLRVLAFGDSLTAGYGLSEADGFTTQLAQALAKMGRPVQVINGGVSGDTTAGGLARLDWALTDRPQVMLLELGANDMLRGLPPRQARANLDQIITKTQAAGITILLIGMRAPANLGADYQHDFDSIYPDLAKAHDLSLYPFFLNGVVGDPALNQADGIHPNAKGVAIVVDRILPSVIKVLDKAQQSAGHGAG